MTVVRKFSLCVAAFVFATCLSHAVIAEDNQVNFYAWGGSPQINAYIQWVRSELQEHHSISLNHVKLSNTSEAVNQVLAQKMSMPRGRGTIDLIWINGENFASMAEHDLLYPDWSRALSHYPLLNAQANADVNYDFGVPTLGRESPWGRASLAFYYNSHHIQDPPDSLDSLLSWAKRMPYRFTYPHVDDFIGISFVKYALIASATADNQVEQEQLFAPVNKAHFDQVTTPLWRYLDELHPLLWRQGRFFVRDNGWLKRVFDDEETLLGITFSAGNIPASVDRFELPSTTRTYTMADGSLSNIHFVAIPFNAPNAEDAKRVADFLLSPKAQAKKAKSEHWGDATVLDMSMLTQEQAAWFVNAQQHPSALDPHTVTLRLKEPHPSWIKPLKDMWKQRYDTH